MGGSFVLALALAVTACGRVGYEPLDRADGGLADGAPSLDGALFDGSRTDGPLPDHCTDGVLSGDETGTDCGGSCLPCAGGACERHDECATGICVGGRCASAGGGSCIDGVQDGYETGVDCGGVCEPCDACVDPYGTGGLCRCGFASYAPWPDTASTYDSVVVDGEAWLVGAYGRVIRWEGGRFHVFHLGEDDHLAVLASGRDDVWILGAREAWHWDGASWARRPSPTASPVDGFALAPNAAWVVDMSSAVLTWDGTAWTRFDTGTTGLVSVWASSPGDVWAGGGVGEVVRGSGTSWAAVPTGASRTVSGIWGTSASDVWLAAADATGNIVHFDGVSIRSVPTATTSAGLFIVSGTGPNDVWAVGLGAEVEHFDGSSWTSESHLLWFPWTIAPLSPTTALVGGDFGRLSERRGGTWINHNPIGDHAFEEAYESGGRIWVVGSTEGATGYFDGASWSLLPEASGEHHAIHGFAPNDIWIAGAEVLHFDGTSWSRSSLGTLIVRAIWGAVPDDVWAVGGAGAIRRWQGSGWATVASPATGALRAVMGSAADDVWAVSERGEVIHFDGAMWRSHTGPPTTSLTELWVDAPDDVWVGGPDGLFHWDGASWEMRHAGEITAIDARDPSAVWIALGETIARSTPTGWEDIVTPACLKGRVDALLVTTGGTDVWAFGAFGLVMRYVP